jgi:hypothetical protein
LSCRPRRMRFAEVHPWWRENALACNGVRNM